MAEYITAADVQNRLTPYGYEWVADRDESGTGVTTAEEAAYVTPAIKYAGAVVDQHIQNRTDPAAARASGNQWLKDRCLDLAVAVALETGGREVPESVRNRERQSLEWLRDHLSGDIQIPGYTYEHTPGSGGLSTRGPRVYNPRRPIR